MSTVTSRTGDIEMAPDPDAPIERFPDVPASEWPDVSEQLTSEQLEKAWKAYHAIEREIERLQELKKTNSGSTGIFNQAAPVARSEPPRNPNVVYADGKAAPPPTQPAPPQADYNVLCDRQDRLRSTAREQLQEIAAIKRRLSIAVLPTIRPIYTQLRNRALVKHAEAEAALAQMQALVSHYESCDVNVAEFATKL